jgi:CheY-like chemotaxis protein
MRPLTLSDPKQAVAIATRERDAGRRFPVILLDANMPEVDGFEVVRRIKAVPALADAAIMMLSSADLCHDAQLCRELGVDMYLVKPVTQSELHGALLRVLHPNGSRGTQARPSPPAPGRTLRVLLAEDNPVNQKLAVRLLEKRGHTVILVENGREAVARHASESFDVILMDVQMPGMDGFEATAAIREQERIRGSFTPIIALTAHAMTGDRDRCLRAGMDEYLSKPIQAAQLYEMLDNLPARAIAPTALPV